MTVQMITATIESVNRKMAKTGDKGLSIVLNYEDGSEWGKKIYQWLWMGDDIRPNQKLDVLKWAQLASPDCKPEEAMEIVAGQSWALFGIRVDLQVDQSNERFWSIINFAPEGVLNKEQTALPDDGVPF